MWHSGRWGVIHLQEIKRVTSFIRVTNTLFCRQNLDDVAEIYGGELREIQGGNIALIVGLHCHCFILSQGQIAEKEGDI